MHTALHCFDSEIFLTRMSIPQHVYTIRNSTSGRVCSENSLSDTIMNNCRGMQTLIARGACYGDLWSVTFRLSSLCHCAKIVAFEIIHTYLGKHVAARNNQRILAAGSDSGLALHPLSRYARYCQRQRSRDSLARRQPCLVSTNVHA